MKYRNFLYTLSIALALFLAVMVLPISPAAAASETIELEPGQSKITAPLSITP